MYSYIVGNRACGIKFGLKLHTCLYIVCGSNEASGETEQMLEMNSHLSFRCSARICDKYQNFMKGLICVL